jgi:phosphatidylserine/phosphatidylglycerophosphate/cardiolipin synthase-like enzyme
MRLFASLSEAGIGVQDDAGRSAYMHNKFWVFDKKIVWTGSTNVTESGIYDQNNNAIVIHSADVAYFYEREWEELWNKQFGPRAPSFANNQWTIIEGSGLQVLFSPEDSAMSYLIDLINHAESSVRFLAFSFTDYPLAQAMIDRAAAGVNVQGVYETFGSTASGAELKTFYCAKIPVRQDGNPSFLHDKIIIVDDSIVVTGSMNFSSNADESNEENTIIVDNKNVAALYLQEYEKIWNQARDLNPAGFSCP